MSIRLGFKRIAVGVCLFVCGFSAAAQDEIIFTWKGAPNKWIGIVPTGGQFAVDWGDGLTDTMVGKGYYCQINHTYDNTNNYTVSIIGITSDCLFTYLECANNQLIELDLRESTALRILNCNDNVLTALRLSENTVLTDVSCYNNCLKLSDLYTVSKTISGQSQKSLGTQTLVPQEIKINGSVNFFAQNIFDGIRTIFTVEQNGFSVSTGDYSINDGVITFYKKGIYTVTMTNSAIVSHSFYPAKAIIDLYVGVVNSIETAQKTADIKICPNPTTGKITVGNDKVHKVESVEIYDAVGQVVAYCIRLPDDEIAIDISHLASGLYFLKVDNKVFKVVKQSF